MSCEEVRALLGDWVDGELEEDARRALEAHAASCPDCARRLQFERRLKELVARRGRLPEPPAYLAERVRRRIAEVRRPARRWKGIAAAVALFAALGFLARGFLGPGRDGRVARALVDDHAKFASRTDALEVAAADREGIEAWFQGRLPFEPRLPGLAARPVGARVCRVLERPCALVFYEKGGCRLSLFVFDGESFGSAFPVRTEGGRFAVVGWAEAGLRYALVSDLPSTEMERLRQGG
ncbi:MAG: zf-HC2 domain-containing protein [Planctomycetes bacterium]|nr:zf-HC2 domain-containing protein [Planctomycetota bacterium]